MQNRDDLRSLFSAVDLIAYAWMQAFCIIIILDDKGGVGKSMIAQVAAALLRYFDFRVAVADTDTTNSTTAQVTEGTHMLDLTKKTAEGRLIQILKSRSEGLIDHVVIDVGAREETAVTALLPWLTTVTAKLGGRVIVLRPLTLGSHNQRNAARFVAAAQTFGIATVFVQNHGQGRREEHFERWMGTRTRDEAIERGVVETVLTDAGVEYADEAIGLGLTLTDVALQDWTKLRPHDGMTEDERAAAEQDVADAEAFFSDDVASFLGEWLRINMKNLGDAIEVAVAHREALDGAGDATGKTEARRKGKKPS